jgi:hypothetical protein
VPFDLAAMFKFSGKPNPRLFLNPVTGEGVRPGYPIYKIHHHHRHHHRHRHHHHRRR